METFNVAKLTEPSQGGPQTAEEFLKGSARKRNSRRGSTASSIQGGLLEESARSDDKAKSADNDKWMKEWNELVTIGTDDDMASPKENYDVSIFGPKLKTNSSHADEHGREIAKLLLAKEADFVDAMNTIDRDNFLADPYDNTVRDIGLIKQVAGFLYTNLREMYLAMPIEEAMLRISTYKEQIRCLRSVLYISNVLSEDTTTLHNRSSNADAIKDKYEATIFTLRRQVQDFHAAHNTVGRSADGTFKAQQVASPVVVEGVQADYTDGSSENAVENKYIVCVQIEDLGKLRVRHRQVVDYATNLARKVAVGLGHAYNMRRTNYVKDAERPTGAAAENAGTKANHDQPENPMSYLFIANEGYNALAFANEIHMQLNQSKEWPAALMQMSRFSTDLWRGIRVRIGVHYGAPVTMEATDESAIAHFEGLAVEKAMRVTSLGIAGDVVVSQMAWEMYLQEVKETRVPPSKPYQGLRAMHTEALACTKKRGFKKGEVCTRVWAQALAPRASTPVEADYGVISFYRLEVSKVAADESDDPTAEELLAARETEITLLQQELDMLRLEVIKRDTDLEDARNKLMYTISKIQSKERVRQFVDQHTIAQLETQLMEMHDFESHREVKTIDVVPPEDDDDEPMARAATEIVVRSEIAYLKTSNTDDGEGSMGKSVEEMDKQKRRLFISWNEDMDKGDGGDGEEQVGSGEDAAEVSEEEPVSSRVGSAQKRRSSLSKKKSMGHLTATSVVDDRWDLKKHKNQKLWRELSSMVKGTTKNLVEPNRGLKKPLRASESSGVFKIHNTTRVFGHLVRRFIMEGDQLDQDDQSLSEEQFITLFMQKVQGNTQGTSAREALGLLQAAAIDNDEVEAANAKDDPRLMRSFAAHLAKLFSDFRNMKKKMNMERNQSEMTSTKLSEALAAANERLQKERKKSAAAAAAAATSTPTTSSVGGGKRGSRAAAKQEPKRRQTVTTAATAPAVPPVLQTPPAKIVEAPGPMESPRRRALSDGGTTVLESQRQQQQQQPHTPSDTDRVQRVLANENLELQKKVRTLEMLLKETQKEQQQTPPSSATVTPAATPETSVMRTPPSASLITPMMTPEATTRDARRETRQSLSSTTEGVILGDDTVRSAVVVADGSTQTEITPPLSRPITPAATAAVEPVPKVTTADAEVQVELIEKVSAPATPVDQAPPMLSNVHTQTDYVPGNTPRKVIIASESVGVLVKLCEAEHNAPQQVVVHEVPHRRSSVNDGRESPLVQDPDADLRTAEPSSTTDSNLLSPVVMPIGAQGELGGLQIAGTMAQQSPRIQRRSSFNQNNSASPARDPSPQPAIKKEESVVTEIAEFTMETRHMELKAKWARDKEARSKRTQQRPPTQEGDHPSGNVGATREGERYTSSKNADLWQPKTTLAPLRTQVRPDGTLTVVGNATDENSSQSRPVSRQNPGAELQPQRYQHSVGGGNNRGELVASGQGIGNLASAESAIETERQAFLNQAERLQEQLIELRKLQQQSAAIVQGAGPANGTAVPRPGTREDSRWKSDGLLVGGAPVQGRVPSRQAARSRPLGVSNIGYAAQNASQSGPVRDALIVQSVRPPPTSSQVSSVVQKHSNKK